MNKLTKWQKIEKSLNRNYLNLFLKKYSFVSYASKAAGIKASDLVKAASYFLNIKTIIIWDNDDYKRMSDWKSKKTNFTLAPIYVGNNEYLHTIKDFDNYYISKYYLLNNRKGATLVIICDKDN